MLCVYNSGLSSYEVQKLLPFASFFINKKLVTRTNHPDYFFYNQAQPDVYCVHFKRLQGEFDFHIINGKLSFLHISSPDNFTFIISNLSKNAKEDIKWLYASVFNDNLSFLLELVHLEGLYLSILDFVNIDFLSHLPLLTDLTLFLYSYSYPENFLLPDLKNLSIFFRSESSLPPFWISSLVSLEVLNIQGFNYKNSLKLQWDLSSLINLTRLSFSNGKINQLDLILPHRIKSVELFNFYQRDLAPSIKRLPNLKKLILFNRKAILYAKWLRKLKNLEHLDIRRKNIIDPAVLSELHNLSVFKVESSEITTIPQSWSGLTNLKLLTVIFDSLTIIPSFIFEFPKLEYLTILGKSIKRIDLPGSDQKINIKVIVSYDYVLQQLPISEQFWQLTEVIVIKTVSNYTYLEEKFKNFFPNIKISDFGGLGQETISKLL